MVKPTIQDQVNYIKDLRDSIDGGFEINILALPVERIMLDEILKSLQRVNLLPTEEKEVRNG